MSAAEAARRAVRGLIARLVARPRIALALLLAVSAAAGAWGAGITIRSDMEALFPEHTPAVQRARRARAILRAPSTLEILIGGDDREINRALGAAIAARVAAHGDLVDSVEFRRDVDFFDHNALLYLPLAEVERLRDGVRDAIKRAVSAKLDLGLAARSEASAAEPERLPDIEALKREHGGEDLRPYFESPDGRVIAVKVHPRFKPADTAQTAALMARVEADVAAARASAGAAACEVLYEGDYAQLTAAVDQIRVDLARASSLALAIIAAILGFAFRRLRAVLLIVAPLVIGLAWTLAFARLTVGHLNLITAFIFAILTGLGIDFAVHAVSRVDEARRGGAPLPEALADALCGLGRPMLAAMATTMATFLALTVFEFRGFSQFGFIAAAGVALCLLAVYATLPPLMAVIGRVELPARRPRAVGRPSPPRGRAGAVIAGVIAAVALAACGLPRVAFDGDMRKMRPPAPPASSTLKKKYRREAETRTASPALIITDSLADAERVHHALKARAPDEPLLHDVVSLFTFVPPDQAAKAALARETRRRLDRKMGMLDGDDRADAERLRPYLDPTPFGIDDVPSWVRERFTDVDGTLGRYVLLYPNGPKSDARHVLRIRDAIGEVRVGDRVYHATAPWMLTGEAFEIVRAEGPRAVALAALVVLALLAVDLRRPGAVLACYLPLLAGFVLFLGLLGWLGIELNLFNIIVLPSIFGLGVDTAIHLTHRLDELGAIGPALRTTGAAAGIAALTTAVGFASLLVVESEGLRSIGLVAVIGIMAVYGVTVALIAAFAALRGVPLHAIGDMS